jgi:hypothetical protein
LPGRSSSDDHGRAEVDLLLRDMDDNTRDGLRLNAMLVVAMHAVYEEPRFRAQMVGQYELEEDLPALDGQPTSLKAEFTAAIASVQRLHAVSVAALQAQIFEALRA